MNRIDPETIAKQTGHDIRSINFIFVVGSHLWGTDDQSSDYDILVVLNRYDKNKISTHIRIDGIGIDVSVISDSYYRQRILEGAFLEFITLFIPEKFVIYRKTEKYLDLLKELKPQVFRQKILSETRDNLIVIKKLIERNNRKDIKQGIKKLIHVIRMVRLTVEYLKDQKIENLTICRDLYEQYYLYGYRYHGANWETVQLNVIKPLIEPLIKFLESES